MKISSSGVDANATIEELMMALTSEVVDQVTDKRHTDDPLEAMRAHAATLTEEELESEMDEFIALIVEQEFKKKKYLRELVVRSRKLAKIREEKKQRKVKEKQEKINRASANPYGKAKVIKECPKSVWVLPDGRKEKILRHFHKLFSSTTIINLRLLERFAIQS